MVKVCPRCNTANQDSSLYCARCGYPLTQPPSVMQPPVVQQPPPVQQPYGYPQTLPPSQQDAKAFLYLKKGAGQFAGGLVLVLIGLVLLNALQYVPSVRLAAISLVLLVIAVRYMYRGQRLSRLGFKAFSPLGLGYGEGGAGSVLIFVWYTLDLLFVLLSVLASLTSASPSATATLGLYFLVSPLLLVIGTILISIAYLRNGGLYGNGSIKAGSVFVIIGPIIYLLGDIIIGSKLISLPGLLLAAIGFGIVDSGYGNLLRAARPPSQMATPNMALPSQAAPAVNQNVPYPTSTGNIFRDGTAQIYVYSPYQAQVVRAEILGTSMATTNIVPPTLNVGYNNIRVQFALTQGLIPNTPYTIQLYLDNGQVITTQAVYS
ncbi:DUF973 family protein [Stygiolobus caldivivus]|nr:DUF973 family protein [Stygiolobus caldivivus]